MISSEKDQNGCILSWIRIVLELCLGFFFPHCLVKLLKTLAFLVYYESSQHASILCHCLLAVTCPHTFPHACLEICSNFHSMGQSFLTFYLEEFVLCPKAVTLWGSWSSGLNGRVKGPTSEFSCIAPELHMCDRVSTGWTRGNGVGWGKTSLAAPLIFVTLKKKTSRWPPPLCLPTSSCLKYKIKMLLLTQPAPTVPLWLTPPHSPPVHVDPHLSFPHPCLPFVLSSLESGNLGVSPQSQTHLLFLGTWGCQILPHFYGPFSVLEFLDSADLHTWSCLQDWLSVSWFSLVPLSFSDSLTI